MKKSIQIIILSITIFSCRTYKIDSSGNKADTWNKRHIEKAHKYLPFHAGKHLITPTK